MQCHYEVLNVAQDADAATIKKAHRKLAIKLHPDKNLNDEATAEKFRLVQEAYECLSDAAERRWYDEHRDALLKGWSPNAGGQEGGESMVFDVIPFMHAHCYTGYDDNDEKSFYGVYGHVFASLAKEEADGTSSNGKEGHELPREFGNSKTDLQDVADFYLIWENFFSELTFSWADQYDVKEAENRRIRRAMEVENQKARRAARKARNEDVRALVRFCKRRDPRMKELKEKQQQERRKKEQRRKGQRLKQQQVAKREEMQQAREQWLQQAEEAMAKTEEMDRLAGRVRLADLEDDYDYGGGKKKGKKKNKNKKNQQQQQQEKDDDDNGKDENETPAEDQEDDNTDENGVGDGIGEQADPAVPDDELAEEDEVFSDESESSEEEEPDCWRCECCRKEFKSEGQMDNHMKSKKHKEAYKKYQKKLEKELMRE